ncbi:MAG: ribonuclease HI family protein, partial [Chloroflexota bacterium]|nr:ribonuclease HI family protein [Chloroflexota bacterium]
MADLTAPSIVDIIEAIRHLTPAQRRQLQRRLRVSGLLLPETLLTDQQRLSVAPALGQPNQRKSTPVIQARMIKPLLASPPTPAAEYRSPVSGKVVVTSPDVAPPTDDAHAMQPLPGQAPEQPIVIIFDGGSKGNPGQGYGSYTLRWPGAQQQIVRLRFGDGVTNNEAEYDTLIAALQAVLKRLQENGADSATARLDIRGDSLLVVNQVQGKWKIKEARMQARCEQVRLLLKRLGGWQLVHHDRE